MLPALAMQASLSLKLRLLAIASATAVSCGSRTEDLPDEFRFLSGSAGSSQEGSSQGGSSQGGSSQGGTSQGGSSQGGTSQGGSSQAGASQGGTSQGGNTGLAGAAGQVSTGGAAGTLGGGGAAGGSFAGSAGSAGASVAVCDTKTPLPQLTQANFCVDPLGKGCEVRCLKTSIDAMGQCPALDSPEVQQLAQITQNPCNEMGMPAGPYCGPGFSMLAGIMDACCYIVTYDFCGVGRPLTVGPRAIVSPLEPRLGWA